MKRLLSIYQPRLLRPTLYRALYKFLLGLALALVWDRFVNKGMMDLVGDGFFALGLVYLLLAWLAYLALDGFTWKNLFQRGASPKKKHPRRRIGDMMDFVDEKVVRLADLEEEERQFIYLASSLAASAAFLVPAAIASLLRI